MAMNNEKMASGSGFKMSPGSKEMDSPHTFREDAPLKQLGMNPMGGAGSPMMNKDNPHYGSRRGKTTAKGLANAKKKSAPASRSKKIGDQAAAAARGKAAKKAGGLSEERKAQMKAEVAKLRAKAAGKRS